MILRMTLFLLLMVGCEDRPDPAHTMTEPTEGELSVAEIQAFDWVEPQPLKSGTLIKVPVFREHSFLRNTMMGDVVPYPAPSPAIAVTAKKGGWLSTGDRARAYQAASDWCRDRKGEVVGHYGDFALLARPAATEEYAWIFPSCAPPDPSRN